MGRHGLIHAIPVGIRVYNPQRECKERDMPYKHTGNQGCRQQTDYATAIGTLELRKMVGLY